MQHYRRWSIRLMERVNYILCIGSSCRHCLFIPVTDKTLGFLLRGSNIVQERDCIIIVFENVFPFKWELRKISHLFNRLMRVNMSHLWSSFAWRVKQKILMLRSSLKCCVGRNFIYCRSIPLNKVPVLGPLGISWPHVVNVKCTTTFDLFNKSAPISHRRPSSFFDFLLHCFNFSFIFSPSSLPLTTTTRWYMIPFQQPAVFFTSRQGFSPP